MAGLQTIYDRKTGDPVEVFTDDFGTDLYNVHDEVACAGRPCIIHNPSTHSMSDFRLLWRHDRRIFERICPHGVGHPDPDDMNFQINTLGDESAGIHGCDGCCLTPTTDDHGVPT